MPSAARASSANDTRAAKKRSSSHPVTRRPPRLAAPIAEMARAPAPAERPRSVSSAEMCVIAPFWAIELQKSTMTRIQKTRDLIASPTVAPGARSPGPEVAAGRSRMNSATAGMPIASAMPPSARYAPRQPADRMSAAASGGSTIAPIAPPDMTSASAMPRRRSNQLVTAREYAICAVPLPTTPRTQKTAYRCHR